MFKSPRWLKFHKKRSKKLSIPLALTILKVAMQQRRKWHSWYNNMSKKNVAVHPSEKGAYCPVSDPFTSLDRDEGAVLTVCLPIYQTIAVIS